MKKRCSKCGRVYGELSNYCINCGIELEKAPNMCSEKKSTLCEHRVYADNDNFCEYCGSLTEYAKEREEMRNK